MKNEENISSNMKARNLRLRESVKNIQRGGSIVLRGVLTIFTISRGIRQFSVFLGGVESNSGTFRGVKAFSLYLGWSILN